MDARLADSTDDKQWEVANKIEPRGSVAEWKALFEKLIADGHQVAILSYNEFPKIIKRYLKEKIGLSDKILNKIFVNSWLPEDQDSGKNLHIDQAVKHFRRN